jgi:hypothetical protein
MPISINFDDRYGLGENLTAQDGEYKVFFY